MDKSHPNLEQTKEKQGFNLADAVQDWQLTSGCWSLDFKSLQPTIFFMIYTSDIWHEHPKRSNLLIKLDDPK